MSYNFCVKRVGQKLKVNVVEFWKLLLAFEIVVFKFAVLFRNGAFCMCFHQQVAGFMRSLVFM